MLVLMFETRISRMIIYRSLPSRILSNYSMTRLIKAAHSQIGGGEWNLSLIIHWRMLSRIQRDHGMMTPSRLAQSHLYARGWSQARKWRQYQVSCIQNNKEMTTPSRAAHPHPYGMRLGLITRTEVSSDFLHSNHRRNDNAEQSSSSSFSCVRLG